MSDFMERARAEAERRWETYSDAAGGADVFDKPSLVVGFLGGARWARDVLLADPTDEEVEAAARVIWYWFVGSSMEGFDKPAYAYDREKCMDAARAAIDAFLAARRGSE